MEFGGAVEKGYSRANGDAVRRNSDLWGVWTRWYWLHICCRISVQS